MDGMIWCGVSSNFGGWVNLSNAYSIGNDGSIETGIKDTLSYILNLGPDSNGMVQFTSPVTIQIGRNPSDISIADFNSDGADDIAVTITDENSKLFISKIFGIAELTTTCIRGDSVDQQFFQLNWCGLYPNCYSCRGTAV